MRKMKSKEKIKNRLFEEDIHPQTGEPVWFFNKDISDDNMAFLKDNGVDIMTEVFIKQHTIDCNHISVCDLLSGKSLEIDCERNEVPMLVQYIYNRIDGQMCFIGQNYRGQEYVIGMLFNNPIMKYGQYFYGEGTLLLEQEFQYKTLKEVLSDIVAVVNGLNGLK